MNDSMLKHNSDDTDAPYYDLFEGMPFGLYRTTPSGKIIDSNPAMAELLGYPDEATLQAVNATDLYANPKDRQRWQDQIANSGVVRNHQVQVCRHDGTLIWVEDNARTVVGPDGRVLFYEGSLQDITERLKTETELRQRNRELGLLGQAARTLSSSLDLDEVLATILEEVRRLLEVIACSVWLIDSQPGVLVCFQATAPRRDVVHGWRMKMGQGLVGWVAQNGKSLIVPDARTDVRHFKRVDKLTGLSTRSVLGVPLTVKGMVIGVLQVVDTKPDRFKQSDLTLLEPLAASAASAIENANLYKTLVKERDFVSAILDTAGALVIVRDTQGAIVRFNPACEETSGYSAARVQGKQVWEMLIPPDEVDAIQAVFENLCGGQFPSQHENQWLTKDGDKRTIVWSNTVLFDQEGAVEYIIGTGIDITERRLAEAALLEAIDESDRRNAEVLALVEGSRAVLKVQEFEETAKTILDLCQELVGATAGCVAFGNDGNGKKALCQSSAEPLGELDASMLMSICEEIYGADKAPYHNDLDNSPYAELLPKRKQALENILCAPLRMDDQTVGWLGVFNKPGGFSIEEVRMVNAFGELAAIALSNSQTLESLEESEEVLRLTVETAHDAIITVDKDGAIFFWNPAASKLFGYSVDEVLGNPLTLILPEALAAGQIDLTESALIGNRTKMIGRNQSGAEFPVDFSLAHWKTKKGDFFTGIVRDVPEQVEALKA